MLFLQHYFDSAAKIQCGGVRAPHPTHSDRVSTTVAPHPTSLRSATFPLGGRQRLFLLLVPMVHGLQLELKIAGVLGELAR